METNQMSIEPDFSIIVPVYNTEDYLRRCVDSLINQTHKNIQIILVDDGSTDKSGEICDEYSLRDNRIMVIHQENGGQSKARNNGIEKANGQYIMFIDSDDYIDLHSCERFLSFCKETKADVIIGRLKSENGESYSDSVPAIIGKEYQGADFYKCFSNKMIVCPVTAVYARKYLAERNLRFHEGIIHEDNEFAPRVYIEADKVVNSGIEFYIRCYRPESTTTKQDLRRNVKDLLTICNLLDEYTQKKNNNELRKLVLNNIVGAYLYWFTKANIYQYYDAYNMYINRKIVWSYSYGVFMKMKAIVYCISPRLYVHLILNIEKIINLKSNKN